MVLEFYCLFSEHLGVLASEIQEFLTVFTIELSLARFWRAFGISGGGGLNTPNPPPSVGHWPSGTVKGWLFWIRCREETQPTLTPTPGRSQNSWSFSSKFELSRIQQKSCFRMTMQYRTQVWRHEKLSQNLVGQCYNIHLPAHWHQQDIHTLVSRWLKAVEVDGDLVEK